LLDYCVNRQIIQAVRCAPRERVDTLEELTEVDTQNMRINEWIEEHMELITLSCKYTF
jgi:macrodomain Ter protein organizer (MatP/YcbG family)